MTHRFDVRSKKNFEKDIKQSHITEAEIAVRLCIAVHSVTKKWPDLIPNGCDVTGKFLESDKVSSDPDYRIGNRVVEITRSDSVCARTFHEKVNKVEKALKNKTDIVFVNGFRDKKQPNFLWLTPESLEEFTIRSKAKYGEVLCLGHKKTGPINKKAYRYDIYWFDEADLWQPLPVLIKSIPKCYLELLKSTKV
jgi:hypothetical protein